MTNQSSAQNESQSSPEQTDNKPTSTLNDQTETSQTQQQQQPTSAPPVPKRLHVSNIPFRFRDPDLRAMFGVILNYLFISVFFFLICIFF